ncbi:hypothetical protein Tco_0251939 [Tanacetum coccineum]
MKSIQPFLKKFDRISFRETPKVLLLAWENFFEIKHALKEKQHQPEDIQELLHKLLKYLQMISEELTDYINTPNWNCPAFYEDDDEEYTIAITPVLPTEEPDNSLSMGDEHLSTIPKMESNELIKYSVENLVPIPSESEDFSDIESECDVPVCLSDFNEDECFDPGGEINEIDAFLEMIFNDIRTIPQDHEDTCLFSILQSSGLRSFAYFGILNFDHVY